MTVGCCSGRDEDGQVVALCQDCVQAMRRAEALARYREALPVRSLAPEGKTLRDVFPSTTRRYGS